jgi:ribosomal protein S6--L-glutamate ligase
MATNAETLARVREPLAEREIAVEHVKTEERRVALTDPSDDWEGFDAGFVYPSRIMEGGVADALLDVPWVNDREAVLTSRNKAGVYAALQRADVPVPETTLLSNPVDREAALAAFEGIDGRVVLKPNSATRGLGVARTADSESFEGIVDYLDLLHESPATGDRSYLVQEFLPDARDYRVMLVEGEYVGAVERVQGPGDGAAGGWKHNVHRGADATGVDLDSSLRELAERTAEVLDIPWLGVDLLVTGDRAAVVETNARPTVDSETKYEPGFYDDLAALIRRTAAGPA